MRAVLPRLGLWSALALVTFAASPPVGAAQTELYKRREIPLLPGDIGSGFGERVQADGEWAIVTAWADTSTAQTVHGAGSVRVLRRGEDGWVQHSILTAATDIGGDYFGYDPGSSHLFGNRIAVAARRANPGSAPYYGRVHIFEFDGSSWELAAVLEAHDLPPGLTLGPYFGYGVCFASENELLVGSFGDQSWTSSLPSGSYYVYQRDAVGRWRFAYKVRPPAWGAGDPRAALGFPLRIDGDRAIGLSPFTLYPVANGVELVRSSISGRWEVTSLVPFTGVVGGASSAYEFAYKDGWLFIADPVDEGSCGTSIHGRVYVLHDGVQQASLESRAPYLVYNQSGCLVSEKYAKGVDFDGERVVVSAFEKYMPGREGSVETFVHDGTQWVREYVLLPSDMAPNSSQFGDGLALAGDSVLVGYKGHVPDPPPTPWWDMVGGAIYSFDLPRGSLVCSGAPNSVGAGATLAMFGAREAHVGDVYGKAQELPPGAACLPLVGSTTTFVPGVGGGAGNLCIGGQLGRLYAQVGPADSSGAFGFDVDAHALPLNTGLTSIAAGETWHFQVWYRDVLAGQPTHNLTHAVSVAFTD